MSSQRTTTASRRRQWLFRVAAILLATTPFVLFELVCVLMGWGAPDLTDDPLVGFSAIHPLFELTNDGQTYAVSPRRRKFFAHDSFPAIKPPDGFRAFCLGESTVQGNPYSIETSFTTWLEIALRSIAPTRDWKIVNCGGVSYASYRLAPILEEVLQYDPDLIILCIGHNEFLEDRAYTAQQHVPAWLHPLWSWLSERRLVVLAQRLLRRWGVTPSAAARPRLAADTEPLLDFENGLAAFHRDDRHAAAVVAHYESNLGRMVRRCRAAGVPVLLMKPCSNLQDCPPFKSAPGKSLTPEETVRADELVAAARALYSSSPDESELRLKAALTIDPDFALTWYELGKCQLAQEDHVAARDSFLKARDRDVCPLRMTTPLELAWGRIVDNEQTPALDLHALLEAETRHGVLDGFWLVDHIHPSFEGHQLAGLELVRKLEAMGFVAPHPAWEEDAKEKFAEHFTALPATYFANGQRALKMLREWTQGRADGPRVESRFPHLAPPVVRP